MISVACTEKGKPFREHAPAQPQGQTPENPLVTPQAQTFSSRTQEWEAKFSASRANRILNVVIPVAKEVLSPARVRNPKSMLERAIADELIALNRMVLQLTNDEKRSPEYRELVALYGAVIMLDCSEFASSCTGNRYLRLATNSEAVLKEFIKQNQASNRVRVLLIALEIKSRGVWDGELIQMLVALPVQGNLTNQEKADLASAETLISTAITQANARITNRDDARKFLDATKVWTLIGDGKIKLSETARLALFSLVAKAGYMRQNGQTHPDLQRWMDNLKTHPESVAAKQAKLRAQRLFSPEAIGANGIGTYNEVIFAIDALYTQTITNAGAVELIRGLNVGNAEFLTAIENYARLQFLASLYDSAILAKTIFTAPVATEQLLRHVIDESAQVAAVWTAFSSRASLLRNLALSASQGLSEEERRKINGLFDSIPRSIKQASAYPHIMVLFYMLSKKRFEVYIPRLNRTMDTSMLTQALWEAKLSPFLAYSEDWSSLNYYELQHAFDMAVRTNLFESVNVDADDLIADTLRRVSQASSEFIAKTIEPVRLRRQETQYFRDFKEVCKELAGGTPYPRRMYFGDLRNSGYFGFLKSLVQTSMKSFNTDTSATSGVSKSVAGLDYMNNEFNESLESARLDLGTVERLGEAMIKSYQTFLTKHKKVSRALALSKTKKARAALLEVRKKKAGTLKEALEFHREFGYCYIKFHLQESRKTESILGYETQYLRYIHRQIKRLRTPGITAAEKEQIQASIRFTGMPDNFQGYDAILENGYRYNALDLWIRSANYHMHGLRTDKNLLPALSPHLDLSFGNKMDLDTKIVRESKTAFIPFVESEDDFAASGIRAIFQNGNNFLYFERSYSYIREYFQILTSLYRSEYNNYGKGEAITAAEIVRDYQDVFKVMELTPLRRETLHQLRRETWQTTNPLMDYNRLFLRVNYDDPERPFGALNGLWGMYDFLFEVMGHEELGYKLSSKENGIPSGNLPQREVMFKSGREYFTSRAELFRGNPILKVNPDMDKIMDENVGRFIKSEVQAVTDFYAEIKKVVEEQKKLPAELRPRVDLTTNLSLSEWYTQSASTDFESRMLHFHQQTDNMFK